MSNYKYKTLVLHYRAQSVPAAGSLLLINIMIKTAFMKVICLVPGYYFHSVLLFQLLKFNHQIRTNKKKLLAF